MNVVYLMTRINADSLIDVAKAIREVQTSPPASGLIVMVDSFSVTKANELLNQAGDYWASKMAIPVSLPSMQSQESKRSLLLKMFLSSGYTLFPGPWMIIDSPHLPTMENPLSVMEKLCDSRLQVAAATMSNEEGAPVPYGPVALERKVHHLRLYFAGTAGNWRNRMGLYLKGLKYEPVDPQIFPFSSNVMDKLPPEMARTLDTSLSELSDEDLRETLRAIKGRNPHPATSRAKLEEQLYAHRMNRTTE